MTKISILFIVICEIAIGNNKAYSSIDNMVEKIKKPRSGLSIETIEKVKDPFVIAKMNSEASEIIVSELKKPIPNFTLTAIINHQAYINGKWRKEGENVFGYELKYVGTKGVVMVYEKRIVRLFLPKKTLKDEIIKVEGERK